MIPTTDKEIIKFCEENNIKKVKREYYFTINGIDYVVSYYGVNVTGSFNDVNDFKNRVSKFAKVRIRATKDKLPSIYNDLKAGYTLDSRGNRIDA